MAKGDPIILLKAREHLTISKHEPGHLRLRFDLAIMQAVPELADKAERDALRSWPGIEEVKVNPLAFSLTLRYDAERIAPEDWVTLIEGEEAEARAAVERLRKLK